MTLVDVQLAVFTRVSTALNLLPIKYQAKNFERNDAPYAELIVVPMDTTPLTLDGADTLRGIIHINVYAKDNSGAAMPTAEGQKFLDLFPRDLFFDGVRIPRTGTIRHPVHNDDGWWFTPVLIRYEADTCISN